MESSTAAPFCERNTRAWVGLLGILGALVLVYAFWVAFQRDGLNGFAGARDIRQGVHLMASGSHTVSGGTDGSPGQATPASDALLTGGVSLPHGVRTSSVAGTTSLPVEVVTGATPGGGFRLVGQSQALGLQGAFNNAADVIRPCVVKVSVSASGWGGASSYQAGSSDPQFLAPFDGTPDVVIDRTPYENVGSGIIVDPSGLVVTNLHVVAGASSLVVNLYKQAEEHLPATLVATDASCDMALLRIAGDEILPAATLGDSDRVEVGDWVLAVGNPFGLEHTVTAGIVGARGAILDIGGIRYRELLQTDAPINRGSSGGPLVDLSGKVVGVNTAIYAPTGVFNGTGFAIPANTVRRFLARVLGEPARAALPQQLAAGAAPDRPAVAAADAVIGVGLLDMSSDLAVRLSYHHAGGAFVSSVVEGSVADEAGIRRGDVITRIAERTVVEVATIERTWAGLIPGQRVQVIVWRRGNNKTTWIRR